MKYIEDHSGNQDEDDNSATRAKLMVKIEGKIRQSGLSFEHACDGVGVAFSTARDWYKKHPDWKNRCKQALVEFLEAKLLRLCEVDPESGLLAHPKEVAWIIARSVPEVYGDKSEVVSRSESLVINVTISPAQAAAIQAARARALGAKADES